LSIYTNSYNYLNFSYEIMNSTHASNLKRDIYIWVYHFVS